MTELPSVSVVVPARDAAATIGACVTALMTQRYPAELREVLVVDDGSRDDTAEVAARAGARVVSEHGRGPAAARNAGAKSARGEILLFTDSDCRPEPDWIARMVAPFEDPTIVGAKGAYRGDQREIVARFALAEYEEKYRRMRRFRFIDFVDTYSAAYRRQLFLDVGGFDERYRQASNEDTDLSFRLAEAGHRMLFVPEARVAHRFPTSLRAYARRKFKVGYWKPLLHADHPVKGRSDSHTPPQLRVQVALAAGAALLLPLAPFERLAQVGAAVLLLAHAMVGGPGIVRAGRVDWRLPFVVPVLELVRSYALGLGFLAGWWALRRGKI